MTYTSLTTNGLAPHRTFWNLGGFILCTGGWADVVVNGQNRRLTRGDLLVLTPLVLVDDFRPSADYSEISLACALEEYYPAFRLISDTAIPLRVGHSPCCRLSEAEMAYVGRQAALIRAKQERIAALASTDAGRLEERLIRLLRHETMLEVVSRHYGDGDAHGETERRQATLCYRFLLSLHVHYSHERRVAWYAAEAGLSAGHFAAVVRAATGRTPSAWIAAVTVTYAKSLLEQSGMSIKEIASQLNFPEQFTFRKYFRQHAGLSPKEYRARLIGELSEAAESPSPEVS